jgi:hypothetical protein
VNPYGNVALFHVNTPDEASFRTVVADMPIRYSVKAGARVPIVEQFFLGPHALSMQPGNDRQLYCPARGVGPVCA